MLDEARRSLCQKCPNCFTSFDKVVDGNGPEEADIMFVAEAPGREELIQGRALVGPSGRVFDQILQKAGISRDQVYITNTVKCRTMDKMKGVNRTPEKEEVDACSALLDEEINKVKPKVIVPLGNIALRRLEGAKLGITKRRGMMKRLEQYDNMISVPSVHPAYVIRNMGDMDNAADDLRLAWNIAKGQTEQKDGTPHDYQCVDTWDKFDNLINTLHEKPFWAFDIESTGLGDFDTILGISFSWDTYQGVYVPIRERGR